MSKYNEESEAALDDYRRDVAKANRKPASHTPGPWESHSASLSDNSLVVTAQRQDKQGYERICLVRHGSIRDYSDTDYRAQADAMLIAAAPELLAALKGLLDAVNVRIDDPRIALFDAARAAVAKTEPNK
jgi:hypothetical protein